MLTKIYSVYSLFSALIMHVYQMRSSNPQVVETTNQRLTVCMNALKDVAKVWLVARMVHTLFESILGNKHLEERLQRAAGKRHAKSKPGTAPVKVQPKQEPQPPIQPQPQQPKRKFDDLDMGYSGGPPAAKVSYERSRPVSPVTNTTPAREMQQPQQLPNISTSSPPIRHAEDAFMGISRSNTRANTPFNTYSYPGTPPDLFLHTRNTPNISQDLWQNYQPDQLFPPDASIYDISSPQQQMVDPALRNTATNQHQQQPQQFAPQANMHAPGMHSHMPQPQTLQSQHSDAMQAANGLQAMQYSHDPAAWAQLQAIEAQQADRPGQTRVGPDDTWSNSSTGGPIVPTTLNVGDW